MQSTAKMNPGFIGINLLGRVTYSLPISMFRNGEFLTTNATTANVLIEEAVALIAPASGFIMKTPTGEEPIISDSKTVVINLIVCIVLPFWVIK